MLLPLRPNPKKEKIPLSRRLRLRAIARFLYRPTIPRVLGAVAGPRGDAESLVAGLSAVDD